VGVEAPFRVIHPVRKNRWLNMCIYGDSGAGKTTLAASAEDVPEMRDVLYIDVESGDLALQNRPRLNVIQINKYSQIARIYEWLRAHCQARDAGDIDTLRRMDRAIYGEDREPPRYKTVVLDSLTELAKLCMYSVSLVNLSDPNLKLDVAPDQPGFGEWGKQGDLIGLLIRCLRDLPINVIVICGEKSRDEEAKKDKLGPDLPKSLARRLPYFLDVFAYLRTQTTGVEKGQMKVERKLCLNPGDTYFAKNRFVGFTDSFFIDDPDMSKCIQLVKYDHK
jgi:hypothetical protein